MNQPTRGEYEELKRRVDKLEQDHGDIVENEKLLLKLAKYHRAGLQELKGKTEQIELTQGDTNERLDKIERTLDSYDKHFKSIKQTQAGHTEALGQIVNLSESHTKRFDRIEAIQDEHSQRLDRIETNLEELKSAQTKQDAKLDLILKVLQPRGE